MQLEVFYELNAAAINANVRGTEAAGADAGPGIFKTPEDRHFMLALMLHCADISNAVKPIAIAEKCAHVFQLSQALHRCDCPLRGRN